MKPFSSGLIFLTLFTFASTLVGVASQSSLSIGNETDVALRGSPEDTDHPTKNRRLTMYAVMATIMAENEEDEGSNGDRGPNGVTLAIGWTTPANGKWACIDAPYNNPRNGDNLKVWECTTIQEPSYISWGDNVVQSNQRWYWQGNMLYTYQSSYGYKGGSKKFCMDPEGPSTAPGTPIQIWECKEGYAFHEWDLVYIDKGTSGFWKRYQIKLKNTNMCIQGASESNGASLTLQNCNPNNDLQLFNIKATGGPPRQFFLKRAGTNYVVRSYPGSDATIDMTANRGPWEVFTATHNGHDKSKMYLKNVAHNNYIMFRSTYDGLGLRHVNTGPGPSLWEQAELIDLGNGKFNIKSQHWNNHLYLSGQPMEGGMVFGQNFPSTWEEWVLAYI